MLQRVMRLVTLAAMGSFGVVLPALAQSASGDVWKEVAPMPIAVYESGVAATNRKIYVAGGDSAACCSCIATHQLQVYDTLRNTWALKRPMPTARRIMPAAAIGNHVYVFGGATTGCYGGRAVLNTVERYDITNDTWTTMASMPTARANAGAAVVNGKIYVIGGYVEYPDRAASTVVEVYDPATDRWTTGMAPVPIDQYEMSVSALGTKILVIGGDAGNYDSVLQYDTVTNSWTSRASLLKGRRQASTAAVSPTGPVYAVAGTDIACNNPAQTEVYDPANNTWKNVAPLPFGRFATGGAAVDGLVYLIGGADNPGCGSASPMNVVIRYLPPLTTKPQCVAFKDYGFTTQWQCIYYVNTRR